MHLVCNNVGVGGTCQHNLLMSNRIKRIPDNAALQQDDSCYSFHLSVVLMLWLIGTHSHWTLIDQDQGQMGISITSDLILLSPPQEDVLIALAFISLPHSRERITCLCSCWSSFTPAQKEILD